MTVISDTSPISNLIIVGKLEILKGVFDEIIIPPAVESEIEKLSDFSISLNSYHKSDWIRKGKPNDEKEVKKLMTEIDEGESEAIVLAIEMGADYLLIDERIGTNKAKEKGLKTIGLLGVLIKAKEKGIVKNIGPILDELVNEAGFWIGEKLKERVLKEVNEK